MAIQSAEDLFLTTLSHLHASEGRLLWLVEEMSKHVQNEDVKALLEVRAHLSKQEISNIEECFRLLGWQPTAPSTRLLEVFAENFTTVLNEIQTPELKALYVLHKVRAIQNLHIAEYAGLTVMAGLMGNVPVATLLERNLQDKVTFIERCRELMHEVGKRVFVARVVRRAA